LTCIKYLGKFIWYFAASVTLWAQYVGIIFTLLYHTTCCIVFEKLICLVVRRDDQPLQKIFQLHILALEVLREAVYPSFFANFDNFGWLSLFIYHHFDEFKTLHQHHCILNFWNICSLYPYKLWSMDTIRIRHGDMSVIEKYWIQYVLSYIYKN